MLKSFLFLLFIINQTLAQFQDWESITNMNDITDTAILNNTVWAVSNGGAFSYNIQTTEIRKWTNTNGLQSIKLQSVVVDKHEHVIFGGKDGFIQDYTPVTNEWTNLTFEGVDVNDLYIKDDTLWVATENKGLPGKTIATFVRKNGQYEFNDFFVNFPDLISSINEIAIFNKRVWLATDIGLLSAPSDFTTVTLSDPQNWVLYTTADGLPHQNILSLSVFEEKLWLGTNNGLAYVSNENSIENNGLFTGAEITHIGYDEDNLLVANGSQIFSYSPSSGLQNTSIYSKNITSLSVDSNNSIWSGHTKGGIFNKENNISITLEGPLENHVRFIIRDDNDRIWASSGKFKLTPTQGYYLYNEGIWTNYTYSGASWNKLGNTNYIHQDRFKNVWLATWGGGIAVFNGQSYNYFHNHQHSGTQIATTKDTIIHNPISPISTDYQGFFSHVGDPTIDYEVITAFTEGPNGRLWIVNSYASNGNYIVSAPYNSNGQLDLSPEKWAYFGIADRISLDEGGISSIAFDDFGYLWIGTNGDGIYILNHNNTLFNKGDDELFRFQSSNSALTSDKISSLAKDNDGIMWIGTEGGIHSYDGLNLFRHFGENGPANDVISQVVTDEFNNKWIATSGGLTILKGGFSAFETGAWTTYTTENSGLISNTVYSVFVDKKNSETLIGTEHGISIFRGSFSEIQDNYNNVQAGPNPFIIGDKNTPFIIKKLKENSIVKILDINGNLIRQLTTKNKQVEGSRATWNGKDNNGNSVSSGIYLFLAFTEDGKSVAGKIAVVRK
ncbi:MAG: hypothetical protein HND50_22050 [Calditrichaeota bacterium]|nr:hypothetical protein [Calditrichota bacterium]